MLSLCVLLMSHMHITGMHIIGMDQSYLFFTLELM